MTELDQAFVFALFFICTLGMGTFGFRLGYRSALKHNRREIQDGEHYQAIVDEALESCRGMGHIELTIQAKKVAEPERKGTGTLGLYVVPEEDDS